MFMSNSTINISSEIHLQKPVALVGMMGAGKTHTGRILAKELGLGFVDSDDEIVLSAGQSIPDIFSFYGEGAFRELEGRVLKRLVENKALVIATGGGCVTQRETLEMLKQQTHLIWLKADIDILVERTARRDDRPLLQVDDPKEVLQKLWAQRAPLYAQAVDEIKMSKGTQNVIKDILCYLDSVYNR